MKALLDTNIIIHREAPKVFNQDIGILYKWLDKAMYQKCIHQVTIDEICKNPNKETVNTFLIKLDSYERLLTAAPMSVEVKLVSAKFDVNENDRNDTILLNELFNNRVDILISEDKKIHSKAKELNLSDKVFKINSFLEKVVSEHPTLINYKVLSVTKKLFGELDLKDSFFDSFREDYIGFNKWFNNKANETAYVTFNNKSILSFLYIKPEDKDENYSNINPIFTPKRRLKIGTFKVVSNGVRLGERFLKIIFDNAIQNKVDEIYVTIFDKRDEQQRLISLLEDWGFVYYGKKNTYGGEELVYVREFAPHFNKLNPKLSFPFITTNTNIFLIPIYPEYHTDLLPDSYLRTESPNDFIEHEPHRNAISKVYISRSFERGIKTGDILIFYRTAKGGSAYYTSVITTIGTVEEKIENIKDENEFILRCRKRSVFTDEGLKKFWNYNAKHRPFIINFLAGYSFGEGHRLNRQKLLDLNIITGGDSELRGLKKISKEQFQKILNETQTNASIIVN
jgi:hypothetical protein